MLEVESLFNLLSLSAGLGTKLFLVVEGKDEVILLDNLRRLIEEEKFGEE